MVFNITLRSIRLPLPNASVVDISVVIALSVEVTFVRGSVVAVVACVTVDFPASSAENVVVDFSACWVIVMAVDAVFNAVDSTDPVVALVSGVVAFIVVALVVFSNVVTGWVVSSGTEASVVFATLVDATELLVWKIEETVLLIA